MSDKEKLGGYPDFSELVKEMNKEYSVINMGGKSRVAKLMNDGTISFQALQDFKNFLLNKTETVISGKKHNKITHANIYLASPLRKEYLQGIEFFPTTGDPDRKNGKLNTWSGFGYKRKTYDINRIKIFLDYIENVVCGGNAEYAQYLMGWIARGFQKPHLQAEIAVVLIGDDGSWSMVDSILVELMNILWGYNSVRISSLKKCAGNFNGILDDKCFVSGDPSLYGGDKKSESMLKSIITDLTLHIKRKGYGAVEHPNRLKIMLTANDSYVIPPSHDEHRYFCLYVSPNFKSRADRLEYYEDISKLMGDSSCGAGRDNEAFAMLFDYFLSYDIKEFNPANYPKN